MELNFEIDEYVRRKVAIRREESLNIPDWNDSVMGSIGIDDLFEGWYESMYIFIQAEIRDLQAYFEDPKDYEDFEEKAAIIQQGIKDLIYLRDEDFPKVREYFLHGNTTKELK